MLPSIMHAMLGISKRCNCPVSSFSNVERSISLGLYSCLFHRRQGIDLFVVKLRKLYENKGNSPNLSNYILLAPSICTEKGIVQ